MTAMGAGNALGALSGALPDSPTAARVVDSLLSGLVAPSFSLLPFLVLCFPGGPLPGPRWRGPAIVAGTAVGLLLVAEVLRPDPDQNPLGIGPLGGAIDAVYPMLGLLVAAFGLAALVNAYLRLRRASGVERRQLRWFAYSASMFPVLMLGNGLLRGLGPGYPADALLPVVFVVGVNGISVAIGVAVLRYRLYDIDRLVSRTVSYAVLTALLALPYLGVVALTSNLAGGAGDLGVALATLAAAAAFNPLRRRVQARVDRRFNRGRFDAARTIDAFSSRLRNEVDLDTLQADLLNVVHSTMQPRAVGLWLRTTL